MIWPLPPGTEPPPKRHRARNALIVAVGALVALVAVWLAFGLTAGRPTSASTPAVAPPSVRPACTVPLWSAAPALTKWRATVLRRDLERVVRDLDRYLANHG
ncbi:MAG TPA: hypothetical protein VGJ54_19460 [Streptosporangiaceae bacterium]|jgi:hypothetical protein